MVFIKVHIDFCEKQHFKARARDFTDIEMDEPKSFHGSNLAASPVEYLLIGIGGCLGSTLSFCMRKNNLEIEDLMLTVDGILKHTEPKNRLRLNKVIVEVQCKAIGPDKLKDKCFNEFRDYCIVSNSLGIPIDIKIEKK